MESQRTEINRAKSFRQKLLGLIPYKRLSQNRVLLIENCRSIHTFFMRFPIDVIFVDENDIIVKLKENLKAYRFLAASRKAGSVYEAAVGFIKRFDLKVGESIRKAL